MQKIFALQTRAALIPSPRVNLTRFHGVFAPNSQYRAEIIIKKSEKKSVEKELPTEGGKNLDAV